MVGAFCRFRVFGFVTHSLALMRPFFSGQRFLELLPRRVFTMLLLVAACLLSSS